MSEIFAFQENFVFSNEKCKKAETNLIELSKKMNVPSKYFLGFRNTGALISFYYNTPNNTIGLLWYNNVIFNRYISKNNRLREIRENSSSRIEFKRNRCIRKYDENSKYIYMCQIILRNKGLDFNKICSDMGLSEKQVNLLFKEMLDKGIIDVKNYKLNCTPKVKKSLELKKCNLLLKNRIKISKIKYVKNEYCPKNFQKKFKGYQESNE